MNARATDRDDLILRHYATVHQMARMVARRYSDGQSVEDLVSIGTLGLIDAVDRYDSDREDSFGGYARIRIRGAMVDALRRDDWVPRSVRQRARQLRTTRSQLELRLSRPPSEDELATALDISRDELAKMHELAQVYEVASLEAPRRDSQLRLVDSIPSDIEDPEVRSHRSDLRARVGAAIARLSERDQRVVHSYYFDGLNLKEIAAQLGVSESRVSQLLSRARRRLRDLLEEDVTDLAA